MYAIFSFFLMIKYFYFEREVPELIKVKINEILCRHFTERISIVAFFLV